MTTTELEKKICELYDNDRYIPTGADGGVLRYIRVIVDGKEYSVDITLDKDISEVRRIWAIQQYDSEQNKVDNAHNYDLTDEYYKIRLA